MRALLAGRWPFDREGSDPGRRCQPGHKEPRNAGEGRGGEAPVPPWAGHGAGVAGHCSYHGQARQSAPLGYLPRLPRQDLDLLKPQNENMEPGTLEPWNVFLLLNICFT